MKKYAPLIVLLIVLIGVLAWKGQPQEKVVEQKLPVFSLSLSRDNKHIEPWVTTQPPMPPEGWLHIIYNDGKSSDMFSPDLRNRLHIERLDN